MHSHKSSHRRNIILGVLAILAAAAGLLYISFKMFEYSGKPPPQAQKHFSSFPAQNLVESFEMVPFRPQIEGPYGLGFQKAYDPVPLFVNFVLPLMGSDFKLNSFIRKTKMESNSPTISNGDKMSIPFQQTSMGPSKNPVFLVPDIGASRILARWSKQSTPVAKKLDAYGAFQETTRWSCKDTEPDWQVLWFPKDKTGLSRYCWQDLVRTVVSDDKKDVSNSDGVNTLVDTMGSMDFETDIYNTFIEAMYAMSYVQGASLFGASYDHRLIAGAKAFTEWSRTLSNLIEKSVVFNKRRAIITGHGLGALLANKFLVNASQEWKDTYIAGFITLSGTFGPVPKALRVLLSGEILPNSEEQDLIRNGALNSSGLHLLVPSTSDSGNTLVNYNHEKYSANDIDSLLTIASDELYDKNIKDTYAVAQAFKQDSLKAPNVPVNIFIGTMVDTEVEYYYNDLIHDPKNVTYTEGDGTVPLTTLLRPKEWSKEQSQIVTFKEYPRAEHSKILKLFEPMSDLMNLIKVYNE